jgi:hypothetical protein
VTILLSLAAAFADMGQRQQSRRQSIQNLPKTLPQEAQYRVGHARSETRSLHYEGAEQLESEQTDAGVDTDGPENICNGQPYQLDRKFGGPGGLQHPPR